MKKSYKAEEDGHYGTKLTVMQPTVVNVDGASKNVSNKQNEEMLCLHDQEWWKHCGEYNSTYCHHECAFGTKIELPVQDDDILLPDIEPDK